ncbi:MAG: zinc ribbon domain-containing protein [Lancefieldella parvula]|uniref:Zinc ribbon domain-containing protein n=1 Tax=Lancefieldella parvula TaxID=1382 RepID=A0A9E7ACT2_9ACTN|nr:MAG: zinc ribbon domain-containing protein [Lancefieldella parvula]
MNCPNCGAEISKHAKFCSNCGQKLSDVADAANVADVANVEKTDALAESTEPAPETAPDNSTAATEVIAPAEADEPAETATDPDATVLAEYPVDDEDTTAAETSLLEISADDSYIAPDEAPTAVTDSDAVADADADADADPTVIANSNAAAEEPTTFINDPDRINVFTADDLDSTAISHFDPSQFTVVSSGPSSVERKQTKDGSDALRKVGIWPACGRSGCRRTGRCLGHSVPSRRRSQAQRRPAAHCNLSGAD